MKKFGKVMIAAAVCTLWGNIAAFAGEWKSDANGRWYVKDDGNYVISDWLADNGKMYYFNADGYMVSNTWVGNYYVGNDGAMLTNTTTPDGYYVGMDGAWVEDGQPEVQDMGYLEKYAEVLRNVLNGVSQGGYLDGWDQYSFQLVYVDGDEVPELVILGSTPFNYRTNTRLYTYYQGQVCMLGDFYAQDFSYVNQENWIKSQVFGSGSTIGDESFYTIKDGKMVTAAWFSDAYNEYLISGKKVSKSEYENQLNAMKNGHIFKEVDSDTTHELNEENIQKMLTDMNSAM